MIDPLTSLAFAVSENKGVFALVVGSGISRAAFIPTGWEITLDLIRRVAVAQDVRQQGDWAKWYRHSAKKEPNYSELLDALSSTQEERRSLLHSYIEPTPEERQQGRKVPTRAHRAIARLVRDGFVRVIVTTNFDRLLETALRDAGIEPTVVSNEDSAHGAVPLSHDQCFLLKVHGDYLDTRILNTESELSSYPEAIDQLLDRIFDEYGLVICGWSGEWDTALRAAFLRATSRRYSVVWATRHDPGQFAQDLVQYRKGRFLTIEDADSFLDVLATRVELLAETRRQNPASTDLVVQAGKQYIAKPECRVQLHDLVLQELRRAIEQRDVPDLKQDGPFNANEFNRRISRYDALCEPLVRLIGILGRHGNGAEFNLIVDVLRTLTSIPSRGGATFWIDLHKKYPAMLMLFAYGLGALKAGRYKVCFDALNLSIPREYEEPLASVEYLFLYPTMGSEVQCWNWLTGMEKARTPVSEHLLAKFNEWSVDYSLSRVDVETLYERFEFLGALAFLSTHHSAQEIEQQVAASQPQSWAWAPMGRISWHTSSLTSLVKEASSGGLRDQLLMAGFCKSDARHLDASLRNLTKIGSRARFGYH